MGLFVLRKMMLILHSQAHNNCPSLEMYMALCDVVAD